MLNLKHLLVVVDTTQAASHALPRALELAKKFDCEITVVTCVYQKLVDIITPDSGLDEDVIKAEAMAHYEKKLRQQVLDLNNGISELAGGIHYEVLWNRRLQEGLASYIQENSFDLVVKTARNPNLLERMLFTPTDWHLLRETQANLLFVKKGAWPSSSCILGAININGDEAHQTLNREIIDTTAEMARLFKSEAKILNVFPWPAVDLSRFNYLFERKDQFLAIKDQHRSAVKSYVKNYPELVDNIIIAEGLEPEETIPEIVKATFSDLLIMGCVSRRGVTGAFIGNTAEKILDQINCEVLVLN